MSTGFNRTDFNQGIDPICFIIFVMKIMGSTSPEDICEAKLQRDAKKCVLPSSRYQMVLYYFIIICPWQVCYFQLLHIASSSRRSPVVFWAGAVANTIQPTQHS